MKAVNTNDQGWVPTRKVTAAAAGALIVLFFRMISAEFNIVFKPETWSFISTVAPVLAGYLMPEKGDEQNTTADFKIPRLGDQRDSSNDNHHVVDISQ